MNIYKTDEKRKRKYRSKLRAAQAGETRKAILDAAHRLFIEEGYSAASIRHIAEEADVAEPTVYAVFGDKASVAAAVIERATTGDREEDALHERWMDRIHREPSLSERLRVACRWNRELFERGVPELRLALELGAASDPKLTELGAAQDEVSYRETAESIELVLGDIELPNHRRTHLTDAAWALTSSHVYRRLVHQRGWSATQYEEWLYDGLSQLVAKCLNTGKSTI